MCNRPDGRGTLLTLTARGNQILLHALPTWQEAQERAQSLLAEALLGLEAGKEALSDPFFSSELWMQLCHRRTAMASNTQSVQPNAATTAAPMRRPLPRTLPGAATYVVLAIWAAAVTTAIVADVFAGDGASRLLLPAAQAIPIAAAAIGCRASPRFRNYLLALDLRLVLTAQLWRVIGIAFLFALAFGQLSAGFAVPAATGLSMEPSALTAWPLAIFPTLMIPFFAVLHLVAVLQSRHDWDDRVRHYAIPSRDLAPTPDQEEGPQR